MERPSPDPFSWGTGRVTGGTGPIIGANGFPRPLSRDGPHNSPMPRTSTGAGNGLPPTPFPETGPVDSGWGSKSKSKSPGWVVLVLPRGRVEVEIENEIEKWLICCLTGGHFAIEIDITIEIETWLSCCVAYRMGRAEIHTDRPCFCGGVARREEVEIETESEK